VVSLTNPYTRNLCFLDRFEGEGVLINENPNQGGTGEEKRLGALCREPLAVEKYRVMVTLPGARG
jgi:hypothetical protein